MPWLHVIAALALLVFHGVGEPQRQYFIGDDPTAPTEENFSCYPRDEIAQTAVSMEVEKLFKSEGQGRNLGSH